MIAPPTGTIVDLEAAWLNGVTAVTDLCTVTAYSRKRADGAKAADLRITQTTDRRITNGKRERAHTFELRLTWPLVSGASSMTNDQRYLDALITALLEQIHGTTADHTHGGLFLSVAEPEDGPGGSSGNPDVRRDDPMIALTLEVPVLTATVTYGATEQLITN